MDKYNNPSDNTNNNDDNNTWDYQPDQIDDTQEIPVAQITSLNTLHPATTMRPRLNTRVTSGAICLLAQ